MARSVRGLPMLGSSRTHDKELLRLFLIEDQPRSELRRKARCDVSTARLLVFGIRDCRFSVLKQPVQLQLSLPGVLPAATCVYDGIRLQLIRAVTG